MTRLLISICLAGLLGACAAIDPNQVLLRGIGNNAPKNGQLDAATRAEAFDFVWNRINEHYIDPKFNGVDWQAVRIRYREPALNAKDDTAFWKQLDLMTGELHDSHTRVESPERYQRIKRSQASGIGISLNAEGEHIYVENLRTGSEAWLHGIRPGIEIVMVDGKPASEWWKTTLHGVRKGSTPWTAIRYANSELNAGKIGDTVTLRFKPADGEEKDVTLARNVFPSPATVTSYKLAGNIGYIRFTGFDSNIRDTTVKSLEKLRDTRALIMDLRGNPGGTVQFARAVVEQFIKGEVTAGHSITRDGKPISLLLGLVPIMEMDLKLKGVDNPLTQPLVILINAGSASASELTSAGLQDLGRATVVGDVSCGCLLGYIGYANVPGGGALAYSEIGFESVKGHRIEGIGVQPDILIKPTRQDLINGRDPQFEAALTFLNEKLAQTTQTAKMETKP